MLNILCYIFSSNIKVLSESFFFLLLSEHDMITITDDESLKLALDESVSTLHITITGKFQLVAMTDVDVKSVLHLL